MVFGALDSASIRSRKARTSATETVIHRNQLLNTLPTRKTTVPDNRLRSRYTKEDTLDEVTIKEEPDGQEARHKAQGETTDC